MHQNEAKENFIIKIFVHLPIPRTHLSKDKRSVVFEVDLAGADGVDRSRAAAEGALARLLGSGVHGLPASIARRQVWPGHPAVIPYVEIPKGRHG